MCNVTFFDQDGNALGQLTDLSKREIRAIRSTLPVAHVEETKVAKIKVTKAN